MMDIGLLASAFVGARTAQLQLAIAARMLRMDSDNAAAAVKVIEAARNGIDRLANVSAGIGAELDVTA